MCLKSFAIMLRWSGSTLSKGIATTKKRLHSSSCHGITATGFSLLANGKRFGLVFTLGPSCRLGLSSFYHSYRLCSFLSWLHISYLILLRSVDIVKISLPTARGWVALSSLFLSSVPPGGISSYLHNTMPCPQPVHLLCIHCWVEHSFLLSS